ncbi:hypothetical protein E5678_12850 [Hydrogenophaga sp. PAMC20947]|nr:hypothetical protein E5678_12850 [Hydrogenophaga sp. PAMC20947]
MNAPMLQNAAPALVLLALMMLIAWLLQRYRRHLPGVATQAGPSLKLMGSMGLGPQQRVVTVQVGEGADRVCLVLGVSPGGITALHQMPLPDTTPTASAVDPQPGATGFKARLAQLTQTASQGSHATR